MNGFLNGDFAKKVIYTTSLLIMTGLNFQMVPPFSEHNVHLVNVILLLLVFTNKFKSFIGAIQLTTCTYWWLGWYSVANIQPVCLHCMQCLEWKVMICWHEYEHILWHQQQMLNCCFIFVIRQFGWCLSSFSLFIVSLYYYMLPMQWLSRL